MTAQHEAAEKKRPLWKSVAGFLLCVGAGGVLGYFMGESPVGFPEVEGPALYVSFALAFAVIPLALVVHETGHVIAARLVGFRLVLFAAGPIMVRREGERFRLRFHSVLGLYGGMAAFAPSGDQNVVRRMAWIFAGGPIASLVTAAVGLFGAVAAFSAAPVWVFPLGVLGVAGLSTFLAVTVPSETGGFMTDRARLTLLLRGGPEAELVAANGVLQAFEFGRTRPRDWPQRYLATVEERPADSYDARAGKFCFLIPHYEDTGQTGRVLEETRRAVEDAGELPAAVRPVLWTEAAYVTAAYENDPAAAREYLERAKGKRALVEDYQRSRAEAAILLAEGDAAGAFQAAERGLEELEKAAPSGIALLGREQLEGIKAEAQAEA